jgi:hypothetical protein
MGKGTFALNLCLEGGTSRTAGKTGSPRKFPRLPSVHPIRGHLGIYTNWWNFLFCYALGKS